jgi:hypothetical protein
MIDENTRQPNYATRDFTIPAGALVQVARASDFLVCLQASAPFRVSMDNQPASDFEAGLTLSPVGGFQLVAIENTGAATLTIRLGFGIGNVRDGRISGQVGTKETMPDQLTTGAPVACPTGASTLVIAANSARREAVLINSGAGVVYIGQAAGAAGAGLPLQAGQSITLQTSAALYARNDTGSAVPVAWAELGFN